MDPVKVDSWLDAVQVFLRSHRARLDAVQEALVGLETVAFSEPPAPDQDQVALAAARAAIAQLHQSLDERAALLKRQPLDPPAPRLLTALMRLGAIPLAERCREHSVATANLQQRAIALFVCQYQLADLLQQLIGLVASGGMPFRSDDPAGLLPGGLLDNAA